jgi:23S rRNA G2445 N2-methylase RlmL
MLAVSWLLTHSFVGPRILRWKGLGYVLAREIESSVIGGTVTKELASGVEFEGDSMLAGYAACLWLRTGIRVLHLLTRTADIYAAGKAATDYEALYAFVKNAADWGNILGGGMASFSVQVREPPAVSRRQAYSQGDDSFRSNRRFQSGNRGNEADREIFGCHRAQVCAKDAICDALRDAGHVVPERPVSHASSDVPLFLALNGVEVSIYRDMAGTSLHKRLVVMWTGKHVARRGSTQLGFVYA